MSEPIGWMEKYALADDRQAILSELIPGSDEYYFFHCLHFQTSGQLERSEAMLRDWLALHQGQETDSITAMIDRQRLLTYGDSPQRTIDHLVRRLGIKLNHAPPAARNQRRFPSQFDSDLIEVDHLVKSALRRNDALKPTGIRHLAELYRHDQTDGINTTLREFLERVDGPYLDGLDELVIKEINRRAPNERRFGDLPAHQFLTLAELRQVAESIPQIANDDAFVSAVLHRLRPNGDEDPGQQPAVRFDYLERIDEYLQSLPSNYNSMKASATYRLLEANLSRGVFDRELFERYLNLPRVSPIVHRDWQPRSNKADLNQDFMSVALLPPIGNEEPVVRAHLEHFLRDAASADAFSSYLRPDYLRQVFAETKLLAGSGEPDRWYQLLSPAQRKAIRDAVVLRFCADNPEQFSVDQATVLDVDVKNIDELVLRVYQINTSSYYRTHETGIDTDIDLDGLVATAERRIAFSQPAVIRHRERLQFPEIDGRGVWIVDLFGKGVRARALVRRGSIDHVASTNADGMVFTIIDETRQPIPTATMWVGSREFTADEAGRVVIPPVADTTIRTAIIEDGTIARQIKFQHQQEEYQLDAGMHVDRTQLQSGGETELLIRPRLLMAGSPIDPKMLQEVSVQIDAIDLDGISTSKQVDDLSLDQSSELLIPMRVPARLSQLDVTLSGKVTGLADRQQHTLTTHRRWEIAGIRQTNHTRDAFLTRDGNDYVIEVRGRNGEPVPRATITVSAETEVCSSPVEQTLQADEAGRVRMGPLARVDSIRFSTVAGVPQQRNLHLNQVAWADEIYTTADREVQLPIAEPVDNVAEQFRLLELRDGSIHDEHTALLAAADGLLRIKALQPGDYRLLDRRSGRTTSIGVVDGPVIERVATGRTRHESMAAAQPLGIASIERTEQGLKVRLTGDTGSARVHVFGSRYIDSVMPFGQLNLPQTSLPSRRVSIPKCGYISDLRLGEEYQYVLSRRYAEKYAGVMLPQPGVILNPWETEDTSNESQSAIAGDAPAASAPAEQDSLDRPATETAVDSNQPSSSDYDFVADPGVVIANLQPDANGVVTIDEEVIEGLPVVQIVACDPATMIQRTVTSALREIETVDLRLAAALDPKVPTTFRRGVSIASPEQPLDLKSLGSAQVQVYASVGQLLKLYQTLADDPRLADFEVLGDWHLMDREAKLAAYSRLACHELHLFLRFHDPSFFDEVVAPFLANKQEQQFVDHWLLGRDLSSYATLWRYNQLNAAEQALLAMRLPGARDLVRRHFRELIESQDSDQSQLLFGIETALRGRWNSQSRHGAVTLSLQAGRSGAISENGSFGLAIAGEVRRDLSRQRRARAVDMKNKLAEQIEEDVATDQSTIAGRFFDARSELLQALEVPFYRDLDTTKQWAESQWDRVRTVGDPAPASHVEINAYWADLAASDAESPVVSTNLLLPVESRHAVLVALAVCGLPLSAGEVGLPVGDQTVYQPAHPVAVITKRLQRLESAKEDTTVLIGQRFELLNPQSSNKQHAELPAEPIEFLTGVAYRGQVVVSNPTAARRVVDLFWQLPAGSLPLSGSQVTDSRTVVLDPYAVQSIEYQFYFPKAGAFQHYPANVAAQNQLIAQSEEKVFKVVDEPTVQQDITWEGVARSGSAEQIKDFLEAANLREIDWMLVAHRMDQQDVYQTVIGVLADAKIAVPDLWAYGFKHRDEAAIRAFLSIRNDLVTRVGPVLKSELLTVEPIERRMHELLEYAPLVRGRIHRLGGENQILNPTFLAHYQSFVRLLGYADGIADQNKLTLAYYLLIQNRITEAIIRFGEVNRDDVDTKLQYDYLAAYLAMHQEQFERAETIAKQYSNHPMPRWNQRFATLAAQLDQRRGLVQDEPLMTVDEGGDQPISAGSGDLSVLDRERAQAAAAAEQPVVIVNVEGDALRIEHRNTTQMRLNFYGVDLELLFSKAPFVREDLQRMAMVKPFQAESIRFEDSNGVGRFQLDGNLRRQTLLVEAVAGAARSTALYYGGDITTYVSESYGQLQATDANTKRPISTAYVKVYGKYPDGSVKFYKDGYTDSRGQFDYISLSADDMKGAVRYAILVLSDELGATLHDVPAPTR